MGLGVRLNEHIKVNLGEKSDELIKRLDSEEIRYNILYNKQDKQGNMETIINIGEYDIEIHLINNIVYRIKAYNTKYTSILGKDEVNFSPLTFMAKCKSRLISMGVDRLDDIEVEHIDLKALACSFNIKGDGENYRAITSRDAHGNVFVNIIRIM